MNALLKSLLLIGVALAAGNEDQLLTDLLALVQEVAGDPAPKIEKKMNSFTASFESSNPKSVRKAFVTVSGANYDIKLINELEQEEMRVEGVPVKDERITIVPYLKAFLSHLGQIKTVAADVRPIVKAALEEVKEAEGVTVASVAEEGETLLVSLEEGEKKNKIVVAVQGKEISFTSPYFFSTFLLGMPTKNVITHETKRVFQKILTNYKRIDQLTRSDDGKTMRVLSCQNIMNSETGAVKNFDIVFAETGITRPSNNTLLVTGGGSVKCTEKVDQGVEYVVINLKLEGINAVPNNQAFLKEAMYDLMPIVQALMAQHIEVLKKIVRPFHDDEVVNILDGSGPVEKEANIDKPEGTD